MQRRYTHLVQQSVQEQCVSWEEKVIERKVSWQEIWQWEPARTSFLIRSTYDMLPSPTNLVRWKITDDDMCRCGAKGTFWHILSNSPLGLESRYLWRHNQVLTVTAEAVEKKVAEINTGKLPQVPKSDYIKFCKQGSTTVKSSRSTKDDNRWRGLWEVSADLEKALVFPIVETRQGPDLVIWCSERKIVKMIALTVCWEANTDDAFNRKEDR